MKRIVIITSIFLLLTAVEVWIIYGNHLQVEADIKANFNQRQLELARHISHHLKLTVDNIRNKMTMVSCMPVITKGDDACASYMKALYGSMRNDADLLFRLDEMGMLTHSIPEDKLKRAVGKDFSFREYFKEIKRTGRPSISRMLLGRGEGYVDVDGRFKTIVIAVPIYDNGRFGGVLGASLDLPSMLEEHIASALTDLKKDSYCWIIDDRGVFVTHPVKEFVGRDAFIARKEKAPDISFEKIDRIMREKMMEGEEGTDTYISGWHREQRGRTKKLMAYAPFFLDGWQYSTALATPAAEVALMSKKSFKNTLISIWVITVIMLSGLLFLLIIDRRRIGSLMRETGALLEVKESRDYLQNLLETANDLVFTVDTKGIFTYLNPRVEDYGYTADELTGKRFLTVMTEKDYGRFEKSIEEKARQTYRVELKTKWGEVRICRVSASPLVDPDGCATGLLGIARDITTREQAKAEIIYLKEYNEKIVDSIPSSLLVLDRNLNIKSVNRTYRETRGIKDEDVVGKNIKEVFPDQLLKDGGLLQAFEEVMATRETRSLYEVKHASSDHPEKILNITVSGLRRAEEEEEEEEELILVIEDVTERAGLMDEVREAKDFMETIFETSVDMVTVTDKRGVRTFVNRALIKTTGYEREYLIGRHVSEYYDRGMERAREIMEVLTRDEELRDYRMKIINREGKEIPVSLSGSLLKDSEGRVTGTFGFLRDITEQVAAEEEILKKNEELENFVYVISHDLKSPIVSVQGFASILLNNYQEKLGEGGRRYVERIQANASHMETLISDLLMLSRIGRIVHDFKDVSSLKTVKRVCSNLKPRLDDNGIEISISDDLPVIHCDGERIYQVFENLITNAIKFMEGTGGPKIEIGCEDKEGFHQFFVRDNGIGIDKTYHRKIFEIFQRLNDIEHEEGTGIGLVIVERIVKNHGGEVWVESEKGEGATFYFTLPKTACPVE